MAVKTQKEIEKEFLSEREEILAQPKVEIQIPRDPSNPSKHREVIINGQEFILAVGKRIKVPASVAEVWNDSYHSTLEAQDKMEKFNEI